MTNDLGNIMINLTEVFFPRFDARHGGGGVPWILDNGVALLDLFVSFSRTSVTPTSNRASPERLPGSS